MMKTKKNPLRALMQNFRTLGGLLLIGATFAQGQTNVAESFAYPAGSLAAQNGGSGWLGAWTIPGTSNAPIVSGNLTYPGLSTSGSGLLDERTPFLPHGYPQSPLFTAFPPKANS